MISSASPVSRPTARAETTHRTNLASIISLAALLGIALLAFNSVTQPSLADRATLLCLAVSSALCLLPPLRRFFERRADATAFALMAAFFIIYTLARNAGPDVGWSWQSRFLPDQPMGISWAARLVVGAAILSLGLSLVTRLRFAGITRAILVALGIFGATGIVMFNFLGHYFSVGVTGNTQLNPELLFNALQQIIEFGAVAILCQAVAADAPTRRLAMRALPVLLLLLWARHQFGPGYVEPQEVDDEA